MNIKTTCIRCGKVRISLRKWDAKIEKGPVLMMEKTVCPDVECQKLVDRQFAELREKKEALKASKEENSKSAKN
ncbi:hypothetical protein A3J17_03020 [Candidatus Curtissbacteria bacterium RIFCSPLOWO2_02_FULL_40_11]|uniref:Uncharacterized protein n=2 Tax=Candidatus Curtissiibacteriota TaxID=1752717 RepID=A0A1F5GCA3_9BACT|nr:MAG: hypothetical protein A3D04_04595 [Candidatus Curtissbacteria bacterium RIFCSPHIGHO2_02_FULL_40_16b]OGE00620.1 MAG: hypothetical protein A3J17_03020 [Candidatus Curtissbacteria bacterium RIFCSPLOWO2_02_FULL_40_11]OGE13601.1 MAG: hypothetical protein A3G14_02820 [Candidatus Curtissbacteria bacterium RIFCSPLOWO2_12_FULL_38_9]